MTALQTVIVIGGALAIVLVASVVMIRMTNAQRREIERLRAEWEAGGRVEQDPIPDI